MEIPYAVNARPDTGLYNAKLGVWLFLASEVMLFGGLFTAYIMMRVGAEDGAWPIHVLSVPLGFLNTFLLVCSSITMVYAWIALKERKLSTYRGWMVATILLGAIFLGIKANEYTDKYHHWGFFLKEKVFHEKYEANLTARNAFMGGIPSQGLSEIRGHLHEIEYEEIDPQNPEAPRKIKAYVIKPDDKFEPEASVLKRYFSSAPGGDKGAAPASENEETLTIDKDDTVRASNFLPQYDTFFAIYFTITGLHALHILGGLVIMLYFVGPGVHIYRKNPEHMANRIEVFGIFWHFVDLVWITAFPILYLL